jgi:hypothetical protein
MFMKLFYVYGSVHHNIFYEITNRCSYIAETIQWLVPVAVDTVKNCTPDDGCIKHPKHVE